MRPNRYALARSLGVPLQPDELALHECDIPLWAPPRRIRAIRRMFSP